MEFTALSLIVKGGQIAALGFLLFLIWRLNARMDKSEVERKEAEKERKAEYKELSAALRNVCTTCSTKDNLKVIGETLDNFQHEYVPKGEFFQDVSGWRGDVQRLFMRVDKIAEDLNYFKGRFDRRNIGAEEKDSGT